MKSINKSQKKHLDESTSEDNININKNILKRNSKNNLKNLKIFHQKYFFLILKH